MLLYLFFGIIKDTGTKENNVNIKCFHIIFFFNVYLTWCIFPEMFSLLQKWKRFFCRDSSSAILGMIGHNLTKFTPVTSCRIAGWRTSSELNRTVFSLSYFLKCVFIQSFFNQYKYWKQNDNLTWFLLNSESSGIQRWFALFSWLQIVNYKSMWFV